MVSQSRVGMPAGFIVSRKSSRYAKHFDSFETYTTGAVYRAKYQVAAAEARRARADNAAYTPGESGKDRARRHKVQHRAQRARAAHRGVNFRTDKNESVTNGYMAQGFNYNRH
jgi:hypothetical protein